MIECENIEVDNDASVNEKETAHADSHGEASEEFYFGTDRMDNDSIRGGITLNPKLQHMTSLNLRLDL